MHTFSTLRGSRDWTWRVIKVRATFDRKLETKEKVSDDLTLITNQVQSLDN
jgi:hypothetical protein